MLCKIIELYPFNGFADQICQRFRFKFFTVQHVALHFVHYIFISIILYSRYTHQIESGNAFSRSSVAISVLGTSMQTTGLAPLHWKIAFPVNHLRRPVGLCIYRHWCGLKWHKVIWARGIHGPGLTWQKVLESREFMDPHSSGKKSVECRRFMDPNSTGKKSDEFKGFMSLSFILFSVIHYLP